MFCTRCGERLKEDNLYCQACGHKVEQPSDEKKPTQPVAQKRPMPLWFKGLVTLAFLALVAVTVAIFFAQNPKKTVEGQLKALRSNHLSDAYKHYTAKDFQKITTLDSFKDFVRENPIFLDYLAFRLGKSQVRNQVGVVKATLFGEKGDGTVIEYQLNKEDGKWKILNISILDDTPAFAPLAKEEKEGVGKTLDAYLALVKGNQPRQAYNDQTSPEFQTETSYQDFSEFLEENPLFQTYQTGGIAHKGKMRDKAYSLLLLEGEKKKALYELVLIDEEGSWKIWRLDPSAEFQMFTSKDAG